MHNQSYYSEIQIITKGKDKFLDKTLTIPGSRADAEEVMKKVLLQRSAFEQKNIPISKLENIEVISDSESGINSLKMREHFAGLDFMDIVDDDNLEMYLNRLLHDIYKPLFAGIEDHNQLLKAGIDPVMRNFVYDEKESCFRYVDFLPPKVFYRGVYSQEIPELTNEKFKDIRNFCHNHPAGIIYVTYVNLVRVLPDKQKRAIALIEQFLKDEKLKDLLSPIHESPIYRAHDVSELISFVEKCDSWELPIYFQLRELANWILSQDPTYDEDHRLVYKLSHHETDPNSEEYGQVSSENFSRMKQVLISGLQNL